jgi:hypothetical protein
MVTTIQSKHQFPLTILQHRQLQIEWDDTEGYTCGWLLSEFIRRTDTPESLLSTVALRSKHGQYPTLDYYLTQVDKPLFGIDPNEQIEAVSQTHQALQIYGKRNKNGELAANLDSFTIEKVIGKGGFSKVMQV